MATRRDLINVVSQVSVKFASVPFGVIMIGLGVRHLSGPEGYVLLTTAGYILFSSLLQLGLGYYNMRRLAHQCASGGDITALPDVRGAFFLIFGTTSIAQAILLVLAVIGLVPWITMPLSVIVLANVWAAVADHFRMAVGESMKTNSLLLLAYLICTLLMFTVIWSGHPHPALVILAALGPTYIETLLSFALLMRRADFRELISPRNPAEFNVAIRGGLPMLLFSAGYLGMLNVALVGQLLPAYPRLSLGSLACLRLMTSGANAFYFILQPLGPIILRVRYRGTVASFRRATLILFVTASVIAIGAALIFSIWGPQLVRLWLGHVTVSGEMAQRWGFFSAGILLLLTLTFFCQITSRPMMAAASLISGIIAALLLPLLRPWVSAEAMTFLAISVALAVALPGVVAAVRDASV